MQLSDVPNRERMIIVPFQCWTLDQYHHRQYSQNESAHQTQPQIIHTHIQLIVQFMIMAILIAGNWNLRERKINVHQMIRFFFNFQIQSTFTKRYTKLNQQCLDQ